MAIPLGVLLLVAALILRGALPAELAGKPYVSLILRIGVIAGAALAVGSLALNHAMILSLLRRRRTVAGANFAASILLAVVLTGLVCYISTRRFARVDMTGKLRYSLHSKTERMLRGLDRPVKVTLFYYGELDDRVLWAHDQSSDMLEEFKALSRRITVEELNWNVADDRPKIDRLASKVDLAESSVVFESGDAHDVVPLIETVELPLWQGAGLKFRGESAFAAALAKITDIEKQTVYFLTGHGERPIEGQTPMPGMDRTGTARMSEAQSLSTLVRRLKADNFESKTLDLSETATVPDDCDVLIVADPDVALPKEHIDAISRYLEDRDGRVIVMLDSRAVSEKQSNLDGLLAGYGVRVHLDALGVGVVRQLVGITQEGRGVVADVPEGLIRVRRQGFAAHPVTSDLQNYELLMSMCAPLEVVDPMPRPGLSARALLTGPDRSWGETTMEQTEEATRYDEGADVPGPVIAAVVVEPASGRGMPPMMEPRDLPGPKLVVLGSSLSFVNAAVAGAEQNLYLLLNVVNWMAGKMHMLGIPPKDVDVHRVSLSGAQKRVSFWLFTVGVPACIVVLGIAVWQIRRR